MTQSKDRLDHRFRRAKQKNIKIITDDRFKKASKWKDMEALHLKDSYNSKKGVSKYSSSSSDDDSCSPSEDENFILEEFLNEHALVNKNVVNGNISHRLAVVNMDWDQIKAIDILSMANAFKPTFGIIKSVKIYLSEFGEKRIAEEATNGPLGETLNEKESDEILYNEKEEKEHLDEPKLRKYQLDRLKYYFAIIECDNNETSKIIYESCDGLEFENSSNFLDLRYVPDDMEFEESKIKDIATEISQTYVPLTDVTTNALGNSKPSISWDMDDPIRIKLTSGKIDPELVDLHTYLASNTDEDEIDSNNMGKKYKDLIETASCGNNVFGKQNSKNQIDINFVNSLAGSQSSDIDKEEEFFIKKEENDDSMEETTVFQRQLKNRKELKKKKKQERIEHNNVSIPLNSEVVTKKKKSSIKKLRKTDSENKNFELKVDDTRFEALYQNADYAVDPSNSMFKPGMEKIVKERHRRHKLHE